MPFSAARSAVFDGRLGKFNRNLAMDIPFKKLLHLRLGGTADNLALAGLSMGAIMNAPFVLSSAALQGAISAAGLLFASGGAAWLSHRVHEEFKPPVFQSELEFESDKAPRKGDGEFPDMRDGVTLGYCVNSGERVTIPWDDWMRHAGIHGASGVGKTVLGEWIMAQQIRAGGGLLWVNGKLDPDGLTFLRNACAMAGREDDLLVINPGDPDLSHTYNPVYYGDPDECADRIMGLLPSTESNAGADFYRQNAKQALTTLISAVQKTGKPYNFLDLTMLLMNGTLMTALITSLDVAASNSYGAKKEEIAQAGHELSIFLDQYMQTNKDGVKTLDMKRIKEVFGGIAGRLHTFGTGNFGKITSSYDPDINLFEAVRNNKIVYAMLPTMGKNEAAKNFGKIIIGDYRTVVSWIQDLPENERPWPPFLSFFDEAGSYITPAFSTMFEQARSARMVLCPAVQTLANYDAISVELREMIIGNCWTKVFFKIGTPDSAESAATMIGKTRQIAYSVNSTSGTGLKAGDTPIHAKTAGNKTDGFGYGESEEEVFRITPDDLSCLGKGECVVAYNGRAYQIKVPRITFSKEFTEKLGPVKLNKFRKNKIKESAGFNLFAKLAKDHSKRG